MEIMSKLKITILTPEYPPVVGGISSICYGLSIALCREGHEVCVLTNLDRGSLSERIDCVLIERILEPSTTINSVLRILKMNVKAVNLLSELGKHYRYLNLRDKLRLIRAYSDAYQCKEYVENCDVIHAFHPHRALFIGYWLKKMLNKPLVCTFFGTDILGFRYLYRTLRSLLPECDVLITLSNEVKKRASKLHGLEEDKIVVIPPGVNDVYLNCKLTREEVRRSLGFKADDFIILTVCRLVRRKGVDNVIKAIRILKDLNLKYIIVGDGPERARLESLVQNLNLTEKIVFIGEIRDPNILVKYYTAADVFCLTPREVDGDVEGYGVVFLEAGACRLPVIGSSSYGVIDAVDNGKTGFLVPPDIPRELAVKIELLYHDKELRERLGINNRRKAELHSWDKIVKKYEALYYKVLSP